MNTELCNVCWEKDTDIECDCCERWTHSECQDVYTDLLNWIKCDSCIQQDKDQQTEEEEDSQDEISD